ncbi:MAG: glycogen/starch synthase, partial [Fidelibacterota bacterium]
MSILFITAEVAPFSKAGGLADVSEALPAELAKMGEHLIIITPLYSTIDCQKYGIYPTGIQNQVMVGNTSYKYHIYESHQYDDPNRRIWFVQNEHYFNRSGIYTDEDGVGFDDNNERFIFFQLCIIDLL